jgi:hypothetical protein
MDNFFEEEYSCYPLCWKIYSFKEFSNLMSSNITTLRPLRSLAEPRFLVLFLEKEQNINLTDQQILTHTIARHGANSRDVGIRITN